MRVIENRDGSFSFDDEGDGQPSVAEGMRLIAEHHLERADVGIRLAKLAKDGHGSMRDQAKGEVAAEHALEECNHWMRHLKRKIGGRGPAGREHR